MKHMLFKADAEDTEKLNTKLNALLEQAGLNAAVIEKQYETQE